MSLKTGKMYSELCLVERWRNNKDMMFSCFRRNNVNNIMNFKDLVNKESRLAAAD